MDVLVLANQEELIYINSVDLGCSLESVLGVIGDSDGWRDTVQ